MAKHVHDYTILKGVFDNFTEKTLFSLAKQGYYDHLEGPISTGKEAMVFTAKKGRKLVAIKIYRMSNCDFNLMYNYIKDDPRIPRLERKRRKVVLTWAKREYRNLLKCRELGIKVPTPLAVKNNVLVMDFIGRDSAAPRLKDLPPEDPEKFLSLLIRNMKKLYKGKMVHGDLSHFNILNHEEKPVLIDFSQATTFQNPNAKEYFDRDMKNIANYFKKIGADITKDELIDKVSQ